MSAHPRLNFHHLQYFWAVAKEGNLTRTAKRIRVSPSALSAQIQQLENQLGQSLFDRVGRNLQLTEAGQLVLAYAEDIFAAGDELVSTLKVGRRKKHSLRVGAVATLSRNFQMSFLQPLRGHKLLHLELSSGSLEELLSSLQSHELDVVLANRQHSQDAPSRFRSVLLAKQNVSLVSLRRLPKFRFPQSLSEYPLVLPGKASQLRSEFEALCERLGQKVKIIAEIDDMATLRLFAREMEAVTLVPSVVVRDELKTGVVHELCVVPQLTESFYAITQDRKFQHPLLGSLLLRREEELLKSL